jgi:hypothetical protein
MGHPLTSQAFNNRMYLGNQMSKRVHFLETRSALATIIAGQTKLLDRLVICC